MTKAQEVYGDTLNLLGSDPEMPTEIQQIIDHEHAEAFPAFALVLDRRESAALAI
jgi:hypothetical protein